MITAVDTNVLIEVLNGQSADSTDRLANAQELGGVVICEAVYSEVAPLFETAGGLNRFLVATGIRVERSSDEALHRAGLAWRDYSRSRPRLPACPQCGTSQQIFCERCGTEVQFRQHTLADFLIGGHAVMHADRLLTRDRRSYGRYFPELALA